MDARITLLAEWGCDVAGALGRMLNDEAFYIECLELFRDDEHFDRLRQAILDADAKTAFSSAHALKGVAANLGVTPILRVISQIVEPLRGGAWTDMRPKAEELGGMRERLDGILKNGREDAL